jgi:small subunit ribosomal protein S6
LNKYETVFIIDPSIESEDIEKVIEDTQNLISGSGGTVIRVDKWGKKRLAYEVKGNRDGYYVLVNFEAEPQFIQRLGRYYGLTEEIIKYMTLKAEELLEVRSVESEEEEELLSEESETEDEEDYEEEEDEY